MVLIIRWKITRPWDNNYLEYIIEIYLFFFFFFFSILFFYITQLHFNKLKFPPKKLFTIWKTDNQAERFSSMTIIAKFASVCTRSCKLKYLTLCVLVGCTVRLSEKGIVIVPFSFSLLIFFFFFSFHCSPFSSYYQVYCELLCCENSNESRVFFLLSRANTDTIQIIRNNYSDT